MIIWKHNEQSVFEKCSLKDARGVHTDFADVHMNLTILLYPYCVFSSISLYTDAVPEFPI